MHFDIKPSNVFLDASGAALLADFGESCLVDAHGFAPTPRMYPAHWPPESDTSSHLTRQSDVYQAGLTLYRMCVGDAAWGRQLAALGGVGTETFVTALKKGTFPTRTAFPPHIPKSLRKVVRKALEPNPDNRYPSALALMNGLAAIEHEWLDWQSSELPQGGMAWRMRGPTSRRVELRHDGSGKWDVECWRMGKKAQRLNKACRGQVSEVPARDHAYRVLHGK